MIVIVKTSICKNALRSVMIWELVYQIIISEFCFYGVPPKSSLMPKQI